MRNQKGFSLIEVMIAMGIMSVATMALMQLTVQNMLTNNLADVRSALNSLVVSQTGIASNAATCTKAITQTKQLYSSSFQFDILKNGVSLNQYFLTVNNVSFTNATLEGTGYEGTKIYFGTLSISTSSNKQVLGPKNLAPRPILGIYLTVNPEGIITGCGSAMPTLPTPPVPPTPVASAVKNLIFDADPKVCENFPIKMTCPGTQKIKVVESAYGQNCGAPANYGMATVQALCNGQANCSFTAGNIDNCTGQGVFIDPTVGCAKGYHASYYCQ